MEEYFVDDSNNTSRTIFIELIMLKLDGCDSVKGGDLTKDIIKWLIYNFFSKAITIEIQRPLAPLASERQK